MNPVLDRAVPRTLAELMAQAHALEREAVERYTEFADTMETHNNHAVAALFRSLAVQEDKHAAEILERMGWAHPPAAPRLPDLPAPASLEQAHYLMQPWHALQIALQSEQRAHDFFGVIVQRCDTDELRRAAMELQAEEREHVALLQGWLQRVPPPPPDWADDPDPPRYTD